MITDSGKYYIYRHIRLDKNQPFYIGIGTIKHPNSYGISRYERANSLLRNKIWHDIVSKTKYVVEILLESDDYAFILLKEIEFIKLYGRINTKTGILSNLTDGGEGVTGRVVSQEQRDRMRLLNLGKTSWNKGNTQPDDVKKQISLKLMGRKIPKEIVDRVLATRKKNGNGDSYNLGEDHKKNIGKANSKIVIQYDLSMNFIQEFASCHDVERKLGISFQNIAYSCKKGTAREGFYWKYK